MKTKDSKMLEIVWEAKEKIFNETKNMNYKEYFSYIKNSVKSSRIKKELYIKIPK